MENLTKLEHIMVLIVDGLLSILNDSHMFLYRPVLPEILSYCSRLCIEYVTTISSEQVRRLGL